MRQPHVDDFVACPSCGAETVITGKIHSKGMARFDLQCGHKTSYCDQCRRLVNDPPGPFGVPKSACQSCIDRMIN